MTVLTDHPLKPELDPSRRAIDRGAIVRLVGLNPRVLEVVRRVGLDQRLGRERMLFNTRAAIEKYQAMQQPAQSSLAARPAM